MILLFKNQKGSELMSRDFESILDSVKTILVDNFNTKLTEISTEKNDNITLPPIDSNAYFLQSLDESIANFDPFIAYGIEDIETTSIGPRSADRLLISIVIVLADNGRDNINRIMFRYSKALKQIFEDNWQLVESSTKINISSSTVVPFRSLDSSATYKAVGIEIETTIAS